VALPPALATADCERLGEGLLAQPVNGLSSLAFLVAAIWILARRRRGAPDLVMFAAAVGSNSVGGVLLHGLQTPFARWIHDVAIVSVLAFVAVTEISRLRGRAFPWSLYWGSLGALGAVIVVPAAVYPVYALLGVAIGAAALAVFRREWSGGLSPLGPFKLAAVVALVLAAGAFFVGRTGGPLCRPESAFQWHAVWHVLAAATMALYARGAFDRFARIERLSD